MALLNFSFSSFNGFVASIPTLSVTPLRSWDGSNDEPNAPCTIT